MNSPITSSRQGAPEAELSINYKYSNNPRPVLVRIFRATMRRQVRIGSEPDRRAVGILIAGSGSPDIKSTDLIRRAAFTQSGF
jgi:hypothetical protein